MRKALRSLVPFLLLAVGDVGQAQVLRGRVVGDSDGQPIAQAQIFLLSVDSDSALANQVSHDGTFLFDLRREGQYRLRAEALGYTPLTSIPVAVAPNTSVTVELRLNTNAIALEPLRVVAERIEPPFMRDVRFRQRMGFGKLLTREDLDQRLGSRLADVIRDAGMCVEYVRLGVRRVPLVTGRTSAFRVADGSVCYSALYLNGIRQFPRITKPTGEADTIALEIASELFEFRPQDIEAIEIYRNRNETPPEWANDLADCGVVAIWLRSGYDHRADDRPYHGPWPKVSLNVAGSSYRLAGPQSPDAGTAIEVAAHWQVGHRISAGLRLNRSSHTLSSQSTHDLMRGLDSGRYDVDPGQRPMALFILTAEPRLTLLPDARLTPIGALRFQIARRSFAVDDPFHPRRSHSFASWGTGVGGAAGLHLRVIGRVAVGATVAYDRLFFGTYGVLERPSKRTSATWSATSLRLGVTTRL